MAIQTKSLIGTGGPKPQKAETSSARKLDTKLEAATKPTPAKKLALAKLAAAKLSTARLTVLRKLT